MSNEGMVVACHYVGTFDDGTVFDSSRERDEPILFVCMKGQMIPGFDKAVCEMEIGEIKNIHLEPEEAYGERDERLIQEIPLMLLPGADNLEVGMMVMLTPKQYENPMPIPATVVAKTERTITFDTNHPMAGKALNFEIELLDTKPYLESCEGCAGCGEADCGDCAGCGEDECDGCSGC